MCAGRYELGYSSYQKAIAEAAIEVKLHKYSYHILCMQHML